MVCLSRSHSGPIQSDMLPLPAMRLLLALWLVFWARAANIPQELYFVLDAAREAAPEVGADLLLRLAGSPRVRERGAKRELVEEAFERARESRREYTLGSAEGISLSRVALQSRAVRRMIGVDAVRALRLYRQMGVTAPPGARCGDREAATAVEQTQALKELMRRGFLDSERRRGADFDLLSEAVAAARAVEQLESLAELIRDGSWTQGQLERLAASYASGLAGMEPDAQIPGFGLQQRIAELARRLVKAGIEPRPLLEAWRTFLVRRLTGVRCAGSPGRLEAMAAAFNESLRQIGSPKVAIEAIGAGEMRAARIEEGTAAGTARRTDAEQWLDKLLAALAAGEAEALKRSPDRLTAAYAALEPAGRE